jgi:hypothetical protein
MRISAKLVSIKNIQLKAQLTHTRVGISNAVAFVARTAGQLKLSTALVSIFVKCHSRQAATLVNSFCITARALRTSGHAPRHCSASPTSSVHRHCQNGQHKQSQNSCFAQHSCGWHWDSKHISVRTFSGSHAATQTAATTIYTYPGHSPLKPCQASFGKQGFIAAQTSGAIQPLLNQGRFTSATSDDFGHIRHFS